MTTIGLVLLTGAQAPPVTWEHGPLQQTKPSPADIGSSLASISAENVLCWDSRIPLPDEGLLRRLLDGPCDAWHAGLRLGLEGLPRALVHVYPQWMLTTPVSHDIDTTSPLLTLRALLVRRSVIDQLGGVDTAMDTVTGAGLELGIRWTRSGALVRHVPDLVAPGTERCDPPSDADEFRCVTQHHGRTWASWALTRSIQQRAVPISSSASLAQTIRKTSVRPPTCFESSLAADGDTSRTVSVILPTINRYPYLVPLLEQLDRQTRRPHQVLIVDQTPKDHRRDDLTSIAPALPVTVFELDQPGQSTARNIALQAATGEFVLFIDDDDEIDDDLIEGHLTRLVDGVDAICGGVDDATAGPPPPGMRHRKASDVFPTGNSAVRRTALIRSGLFDPVFDHGPRADRDVGTRLHVTGSLLVYDPGVTVFHHHAPVGGLRTHGARATTRASARKSLTQRNLPAATEYYIGMRYYTVNDRREAKAVRVLAILSSDGKPSRRIARLVAQLVMLPNSLATMHRTEQQALEMFEQRVQIPRLDHDDVNTTD